MPFLRQKGLGLAMSAEGIFWALLEYRDDWRAWGCVLVLLILLGILRAKHFRLLVEYKAKK